jgi:transcriptional regulator with XRE-family HTH domain
MSKVNENPKRARAGSRPGSLGTRLRGLRTERDLTLEQLSAMAGVSKAMLSQIEQDKVNPTVAVMLKIATALDLGISDLVDTPHRSNIIRIIPASDDSYTFLATDDCTIRTLSPLNMEKNIEFYRLTLEHGAELTSEPHFPGTEEFVYVHKGRVRVTIGEQQADLTRGDSVHYRGDVGHRIINVGRGRAEAYMIVHYRRG